MRKTPQAAATTTTPPRIPNKKISARVMDMMCSGNPALVTTETTQIITCPWALPPITLKTKPLQFVKMITTDATIIVPTQESPLVIVMIAEITTASQLLMMGRAKLLCQTSRVIIVPMSWLSKFRSLPQPF